MTTEVIDTMKQFQLFVPFTKQQHSVDFSKDYTENENGTLTIEGIASTTNKDLQGDIILPSAIRSMKQQLLTTTKNLHGDHLYGLDGIYGAIKEVLESDDNSLKIRADILKAKSPQIKDMLDVGVQLGLSIGGKITEYTILEDHGWEIKDLLLMEISLTGMPANWDTYGTITESTEKSIVKANCLAGACHVIRKNIGEIMTQNEDLIKEETGDFITRDDAVDLYNELMASKQDEIVSEIVSETVKQVTSDVQSIVKSEFEKLKATSEEEEEEEDETKPQDTEDEDEEKEKALKDLINATVKSTMEDTMGKLFKDLNDRRDPSFHVDAVKEHDLEDEHEDETEKGFTSEEIAKKMFANQSQDEFLKSLL